MIETQLNTRKTQHYLVLILKNFLKFKLCLTYIHVLSVDINNVIYQMTNSYNLNLLFHGRVQYNVLLSLLLKLDRNSSNKLNVYSVFCELTRAFEVPLVERLIINIIGFQLTDVLYCHDQTFASVNRKTQALFIESLSLSNFIVYNLRRGSYLWLIQKHDLTSTLHMIHHL